MILFSEILSHSRLVESPTGGVGPRKEANSQAGQGCYFTWNKVKVLSIGRVCFPHIRLDVATLGTLTVLRYICS